MASCIQGKDADEKFGRFLEFTRKLCNNHEIALNQPVYESERETGDQVTGHWHIPEGVRDPGKGCGGVPGFLFPHVLGGCDCP